MKTLKIFTIAALASLALPQAIAAQETAPETVQVGITEYPISGEGTETSPYVLENRNHMRNMKTQHLYISTYLTTFTVEKIKKSREVSRGNQMSKAGALWG